MGNNLLIMPQITEERRYLHLLEQKLFSLEPLNIFAKLLAIVKVLARIVDTNSW